MGHLDSFCVLPHQHIFVVRRACAEKDLADSVAVHGRGGLDYA